MAPAMRRLLLLTARPLRWLPHGASRRWLLALFVLAPLLLETAPQQAHSTPSVVTMALVGHAQRIACAAVLPAPVICGATPRIAPHTCARPTCQEDAAQRIRGPPMA
jgi:hypothetical protein